MKKKNEFQCFNKIIIEPYVMSHISEILKEMKTLSENIGMPVYAKFNSKQLMITPTTDINKSLYCYYNDIESDNVKDINNI